METLRAETRQYALIDVNLPTKLLYRRSILIVYLFSESRNGKEHYIYFFFSKYFATLCVVCSSKRERKIYHKSVVCAHTSFLGDTLLFKLQLELTVKKYKKKIILYVL